jgi:hypothetical protein
MLCPGCSAGIAHHDDEDRQRRVIAGHFVERHLLAAGRATLLAVRILKGEEMSPEDLASIGGVARASKANPSRPAAAERVDRASGTPQVRGTGPSPTQNGPDPSVALAAGGCKLCARFAPEKCKHHGGPDRHKGERSPAALIRSMRSRLSWLEQTIATLQTERDQIETDLAVIRDELAAL